MTAFLNTKALIDEGIRNQAYSCAAISVGDRTGESFRYVTGKRALFPKELDMSEDVMFDMASLTKVMSTTMIALKLMEEGVFCLNTRMGMLFPWLTDEEKQLITIKHLMTHTSGIHPSYHLSDVEAPLDPDGLAKAVLDHPLVTHVGEEVNYSCMGYILLSCVMRKLTGKSLDALYREYVSEPLHLRNTMYCPPSTMKFAATELDAATGKYIVGTVHDPNAQYQGGISGNAGIFSNIDDVAKFARMLARRGVTDEGEIYLLPRTFDLATTNFTSTKQEQRGLGFSLSDTKLHEDGWFHFSGDLFSVGSYGHTGFTGTSLVCDSVTGMYVALLTNRVHFGAENLKLMGLRRRIHNAAAADYMRKS